MVISAGNFIRPIIMDPLYKNNIITMEYVAYMNGRVFTDLLMRIFDIMVATHRRGYTFLFYPAEFSWYLRYFVLVLHYKHTDRSGAVVARLSHTQ